MIRVIIPARGGSSLPYKNLRKVGMMGKTLIEHAISHAHSICQGHEYEIIVSTEDRKILDHAGEYGHLRPMELAGDEVHTLPVLQYIAPGAEHLILLQPTHPIRDTLAMAAGLREYLAGGYDSAYAACPFNMVVRAHDGQPMEPRARRQDMAPRYYEAGSFYVMGAAKLMQADDFVFGKVLPIDCGWPGIDIHTEADLALANKIYDSISR
jgi:CMP-N-acetylneuraminic acid synthetase